MQRDVRTIQYDQILTFLDTMETHIDSKVYIWCVGVYTLMESILHNRNKTDFSAINLVYQIEKPSLSIRLSLFLGR